MIDVRSIDGISILDNPTFGVITMPQEQIINAERWEDTALQFTGTGFCTVEIRTSRTGTARITLEIVDGTNVTEWVTGKATDNLVFQSDVTVPSKNYMLSLGKYTIYGNGFVIDASSVTKNNPVDDPSTKKDENSTTEDLISISGGGLDGVILLGGTFGEVQYGSDEKNPYWFHGVNVRQDVTIRNCYIYGFRTPVRAEGGTLNISDTVLDGGCLANIYVSRATNLNLHNVTTIQDEYASGTIGCGLLFANGGTSVLTVTGEFTQYNYATKKQMTKLGGAEYGMVISSKLSRLTQFKHGNYYHTGILILGRGTKSGGSIDYSNMPKLQHNLAALGYTSDTVSNEIVVYIKAQLISIDNSKCGDCSPRLKPSDLTGDGKYNHIDFISRLGDITSSSN